MMPTKLPYTPVMTNSLAIRNEIQRFESVHPSIYAIYDLLELIPDPLLAQEIREHVVCIEDSFVNSQEWTFSRAVPDLRIGVVGSPFSGKSSLVHRYLTGTYLQEESPEGGRFKKEVVVDGQSFQLLIRDEGDPPEAQFNSWVDAVIFVFNLNNETSFNAIYDYYEEMGKFRNVLGIPLILVGTQDATVMANQRKVDEARIRKLTSDLPRCSYYETCSMLGRNVERVFEDTCQKICLSREQKLRGSKPTTPTHFMPRPYSRYSSSPSTVKEHRDDSRKSPMANSGQSSLAPVQDNSGISPKIKEASCSSKSKDSLDSCQLKMFNDFIGDGDEIDHATQSHTPSSVRKNKRRSNLFTPKKASAEEKLCGEVGIGRCIPLKKGHLYKKSSNTFSKTWNKRYVTLCDDGKMTYHPSLHDYMDNVHGKEIPLQYVTVKIPGQGPRGMRTIPGMGGSESGVAGLKNQLENEKASGLIDALDGAATDDGRLRKKFRRVKGNGHDHDAPEVYEFRIVSLDGKVWQFEAQSAQDRHDWVDAIERQIMNCLQGNESNKSKGRNYSRIVDQEAVARLKTEVAGNDKCVDCGAAEPSWASLNLGVLMCIECSGIHRNLGSHVSRVRSLDLDSWTPGHLAVMSSLGNAKANFIWETKRLPGTKKPWPDSSREEKEIYIRAKYEQKQFLADLPAGCSPGQALLEAICKADLPGVSLALCFASEEDVNAVVSSEDTRTPIHIASAVGDLGVVQLLIWAKSDVGRRDHHGRLGAWYARSSGAVDVMELLINAGSPHEGEGVGEEIMGQAKDKLPNVCDGTGYSKSDAFLNVGTPVELFSIIRIVLVEYEVGDAKRSKRRRRSKAGGLLGEDSKFERLLGIATFEIIENGSDIGHSLFCLQPPLISNFEKDNYEDQIVNGMGEFINEDLTLEEARVKFVFSDQTELFADKNTLIRQSSVFERHFSVPDSFLDQNVVQIIDAKPETFKKLLKFMEQKPFQVGRLQSIFDLLYIAEKYLVESLQTICRNAILEHVEHIPSSAVEILSLNKTSDEIICSSVFKSIEENIHLLLQSAQFLLWDFDTLKTVICLKNLNIDEWRLLRYVYEWSMNNFGEIKSGNGSDKCFRILLDCIKLEEIAKENLNSFLKFKDLDKLLDLEKIEITIALMQLRKSHPKSCLLVPASSFRDRNYHYNAKKSPRMFPVTVFSFDVELEETIQLPIVITGDDQTMIQVDVSIKKIKSVQGKEEETDKMELLTKVVVVGSVKGLPDTSSFRVDDYSSHPADFTADFSLHFVQFEHGKPAWCSVKTPFRKKWAVTLDKSLMRSDANGREVFSADLVIGAYRRNYEDDVEDVSKNEEDMHSDFSSFVPSDPESGTSLANHSANSDIFKTDSEDSHLSPRPQSIHSDPDSDVEPPKAKRRRIAQPSEDGSSSGSMESDYDPELGQSPGHDGNESPNQEEDEEDDNSFIDDRDETIESPRAASTSSRVEAEDDSDNDSDVELPKAKRRRTANRLKSDSSSESQYSTDPELGDSPTHEGLNNDGNDINEEDMGSGHAIPDSPDQGDNSCDEFSDGNPGDLCFSPEDCSDGPVFSADDGDE